MSTFQVLIRDIDPTVFSQLKDRAKQNGRAFEAELRIILKEAASKEQRVTNMLEESRKIRKMFKKPVLSESTALIREDRER